MSTMPIDDRCRPAVNRNNWERDGPMLSHGPVFVVILRPDSRGPQYIDFNFDNESQQKESFKDNEKDNAETLYPLSIFDGIK